MLSVPSNPWAPREISSGHVYRESIGSTLGWAVILLLIAERLRNLGQYTFSDVVAFRLERKPVRTMSAIGSLAVAIPYLLAQMVGAGALIQILFGLPYASAVILVGILMTLYMMFSPACLTAPCSMTAFFSASMRSSKYPIANTLK